MNGFDEHRTRGVCSQYSSFTGGFEIIQTGREEIEKETRTTYLIVDLFAGIGDRCIMIALTDVRLLL